MDLKALGFDIAEGVNDPYLPGDCGIFVTRVDRGSVADGRLRYRVVGSGGGGGGRANQKILNARFLLWR